MGESQRRDWSGIPSGRLPGRDAMRLSKRGLATGLRFGLDLSEAGSRYMKSSKKEFETIDEYIKTFPKEVQSVLEKVRQTIRREAPEAVESISYQMPTFKLNGKGLVYFAGYKSHVGFYPIPSGVAAFKKELSPYKQGKGSVQFPIDKPIPYDLVRKIVQFRVKETQKEPGP